MKTFGFVILSLVISHNVYSKDAISICRDYYYGVCLNEESIHDFDSYLTLHKERADVAVEGYRAVIWFLWADYYVNPIKKWKCFNKGKDRLEELIGENRNNVELRFLRLTIQDNLPDFLGYNSNINDDKDFIYHQISSIVDKDLYGRIVLYLRFNGMAKIE